MIMRALTASGDWQFGRGIGSYNTAEAAIEENIMTWLNSWVGNCFFALKDGVDWLNLLDVGQQVNLKNAVKLNILKCYGVVQILALEVVFVSTTRAISITAQIQTIYSKTFQLELSQIAGVPFGQ